MLQGDAVEFYSTHTDMRTCEAGKEISFGEVLLQSFCSLGPGRSHGARVHTVSH